MSNLFRCCGEAITFPVLVGTEPGYEYYKAVCPKCGGKHEYTVVKGEGK